MTKLIIFGTVFYFVLIFLIGLAGATIDDSFNLQPPERPEFNLFSETPLLGRLLAPISTLAEIIVFSFSYATYLFSIIFSSFVNVYPFWLNVIVFFPLVALFVYEIIARLIRGSGSG